MQVEDQPRLLIIDDDPMIRLLATQSLAAGGYETMTAASAEDGLTLYDHEHPDLVLLDVILPGMDGFTACRILREHPAGTHVPIIMLTGLDDTDSIHRAYESGATDFVTKPINWLLLAYRARYALRGSRALADLAASQATLANAQRIAQLGSWEWIAESKTMRRSEECVKIFGRSLAPVLDASLPLIHPDDRPAVERAMHAAVTNGVAYEIDYRIERPDRSWRTVHEQVEVVLDGQGNMRRLQGISQDITERVEANEKIHHLAYYDGLTGLANRVLFHKLGEAALQRAERQRRCCALLCLDIDRFKRVNETLTHVVGDQLLKVVSERIVNIVRCSDIANGPETGLRIDPVARSGGDEFAVLLPDLVNPEDAARVARRIIDEVARPMELGPHEVTVTASIGIASYPHDAENLEALLKNADTALYSAKERGRNNYQFYSRPMNASAFERLTLENDLRRAVSDGQFVLYYQPKVDAMTGAVVGAEALLRWNHPKRGLMSAGDFIPIAEETGLIVPIGDWVIRHACAQNGRWRRAGLGPVPVAINLAAPNFHNSELSGSISRALADSGLDPSLLELEITESVLMDDLETALRVLDRLKAMNLTLTLDDFGTGYSSLNYLKRLPIDVLKIDRSFIQDITEKANDAAIACSIIALGNHLAMGVVAEGVETGRQAELLLRHGCRIMQGFYYSRPLPAAEFEALLSSGCSIRRARPAQLSVVGS